MQPLHAPRQEAVLPQHGAGGHQAPHQEQSGEQVTVNFGGDRER